MKHNSLIITIGIMLVSLFWSGTASAGWTAGKIGSAIDFNGTSTYVDGFGALGNIQTVTFWIKADSLSKSIMALNGTQTITVSAGVISANSFTSPVIFVDGVISSTLLDTAWHYITITTATSVSASAVVIGKVGANYFDGILDEVRMYGYARAADEIRLDYNAGFATHLGPTGKTCVEDPASCVNNGLVGYWNMDEGGASTAKDSSGNGNNGILTNGPLWTKGKKGNALKFDGKDDYVDAGNEASLDITNAITISAWVNPNLITGTSRIIATKSSVYYFQINSNGKLEVYLYGTTSPGYHQMTSTIPLDTWTHVAVTYDGANVVLYKDSSSESFSDTGSLASNFNNFYLGSDAGVDRQFSGSIDEVRIYNRALSPEEINYHYNEKKPVVQWDLDEGTGTTARDSAGNLDITFPATESERPTWVKP